MISPEVQPQQPEDEPLLTTGEGNQIQIELITRSGLAPEEWIGRYAASFRGLVEASPTLRKLIRDDQVAALGTIEAMLRDGERLH